MTTRNFTKFTIFLIFLEILKYPVKKQSFYNYRKFGNFWEFAGHFVLQIVKLLEILKFTVHNHANYEISVVNYCRSFMLRND